MRQQKVSRSVRRPLFPTADDLHREDDLVEALFQRAVIEVPGQPTSTFGPLVLENGQDQMLKVVFLWCAPCRSVVAGLRSLEVGRRLSGHEPYLVAYVQWPSTHARPAEDMPKAPAMTVSRVLLSDADEPGVEVLRRFTGVHAPPEQLSTYCPVHRRLTFSRNEALRRAARGRHAIIRAEQTGDTPKPGRWKLSPG